MNEELVRHISRKPNQNALNRTDPHLPDMPIVYASEAFLKLTGYDGRRVLGHNCRFLSGMDTDPTVQLQIKECIRTKQPCTVLILNYRKDGISVWNFLHVSLVKNASGKVAYCWLSDRR
ncbi:Protein TWIN LOV 1 [Forsythia ovata]|uniref:Protein TWIN LOV 1 n=1 Tax=Forsythia ovata TaxID=205694 RepID=A0ABD1TCA4_9LAMI